MHIIIRFIKNWTLPISMVMGVISYFVYVNIHALDNTHQQMSDFISLAQPSLIFMMLFLAFCKVKPKELRPHAWQLKLIAVQSISFAILALPILYFPQLPGRVVIESAMICLICPTATAASVVTTRLQGNASSVISYTCVINLVAALLIPAIVSLIHSNPSSNISFIASFSAIICRVFPLLILPLILAFTVRYMLPRLHAFFVRIGYISFYLWAVTLTISIGITTKAIVHSHETIGDYIGIALVSAVTCILQFYLGRTIGRNHQEPIAGAQSLGQKNTAFAIWVSYTFMNPVTALAGGFYAVWHNIYNSYQLYQHSHTSLLSPIPTGQDKISTIKNKKTFIL